MIRCPRDSVEIPDRQRNPPSQPTLTTTKFAPTDRETDISLSQAVGPKKPRSRIESSSPSSNGLRRNRKPRHTFGIPIPGEFRTVAVRSLRDRLRHPFDTGVPVQGCTASGTRHFPTGKPEYLQGGSAFGAESVLSFRPSRNYSYRRPSADRSDCDNPARRGGLSSRNRHTGIRLQSISVACLVPIRLAGPKRQSAKRDGSRPSGYSNNLPCEPLLLNEDTAQSSGCVCPDRPLRKNGRHRSVRTRTAAAIHRTTKCVHRSMPRSSPRPCTERLPMLHIAGCK